MHESTRKSHQHFLTDHSVNTNITKEVIVSQVHKEFFMYARNEHCLTGCKCRLMHKAAILMNFISIPLRHYLVRENLMLSPKSWVVVGGGGTA